MSATGAGTNARSPCRIAGIASPCCRRRSMTSTPPSPSWKHSSPCSKPAKHRTADMPTYTPPVRDTRFVLEHVLGIDRYKELPGFDGATPDVVDAVLEEGGRFVAEILFPLNHSGDQEGCT